VPVSAFVFGGRDSTAWPPVEEALDWDHGIATKGAALESERTAAVLGKVGEVEFNPFAILDFLPISPGAFAELHFRFARRLRKVPKVFGVNYFLRGRDGKYLAEKRDKRVWLKWMELRVHGKVDAVETPTGRVPVYEDLRQLFDRELGKEFSERLYEEMFAVRIPQQLAKLERVLAIYERIPDSPPLLLEILREQGKRLKELQAERGDWVSPFELDKR